MTERANAERRIIEAAYYLASSRNTAAGNKERSRLPTFKLAALLSLHPRFKVRISEDKLSSSIGLPHELSDPDLVPTVRRQSQISQNPDNSPLVPMSQSAITSEN